jgi:hypothetical protein
MIGRKRMGDCRMSSRIAALTALCLCALALAPRPAAAEMSVGMLKTLCESKENQDEIACGSYLLGVMDAFRTSATQYGAKIPFCYPKAGLSAKDMNLAFRLWASTNPGEEKTPAISGIAATMVERFPCK